MCGCCGILIASRLEGDHVTSWTCLCLASVAALWIAPARAGAVLLVTAMIPFFGLRYAIEESRYDSASILNLATVDPRPVILEGVVDDSVSLRRHPLADQQIRRNLSPWQSRIEVALLRHRNGYQFEPCSGRVIVVCNGNREDLLPGDVVRVMGNLSSLEAPTNPGQNDLRDHYRREHIHGRVNVGSESQVTVIGRDGYRLSRTIAVMARSARQTLWKSTDEGTAPLAIAMVIGQRDFVDPNTRDLLIVTGTAHLLSVSGLHVAIVMLLTHWVVTLIGLSPTWKNITIIIVCVIYMLITGFRPPAMRAGMLVIAFLIAMWVKRPVQPLNALALAAIFLMLWSPSAIFGVGTQLSFLAVTTLMMSGQPRKQSEETEDRLRSLIEDSYSWPRRLIIGASRKMLQIARFSAFVTAVSLPLVWHQFHVVSVVSVLSNVLLGPFLFVSLGLGVLTVLLGWIYQPLSLVTGSLSTGCLRCMHEIIYWMGEIPYGHFWLPSPPWWMVVAIYAAFGATLFVPSNRYLRTVRWVGFFVWVFVAGTVSTTPAKMKPGSCEATFVDVGHGTSVVIRFSSGEIWLYDCGRLGNDVGSSRSIDEVLWSLGATRLDKVFLSHADADHYNALPGILRRFHVESICTPPEMLGEPETSLEAVRQAIDRKGVQVIELSTGDQISVGDSRVDVLHPPRVRVPGNDNANSLVLQLIHGDESLLLPGDLEPPGIVPLISQRRPPPGGVLMAPHHGSTSMDSSTVLFWARPRFVVVSGGRRAKRPEVHEMLSISGSEIHVTATHGAIRVRMHRDGLIRIDRFVEAPW